MTTTKTSLKGDTKLHEGLTDEHHKDQHRTVRRLHEVLTNDYHKDQPEGGHKVT